MMINHIPLYHLTLLIHSCVKISFRLICNLISKTKFSSFWPPTAIKSKQKRSIFSIQVNKSIKAQILMGNFIIMLDVVLLGCKQDSDCVHFSSFAITYLGILISMKCWTILTSWYIDKVIKVSLCQQAPVKNLEQTQNV